MVLQDVGASVRSHEGAVRGDGWRVYDLPDNVLGREPDLLLSLVVASSCPVIAAYIADSDYGQVVAATPSGDQWGVWLDRDTACAFERDHHAMIGMARKAVRRRARETIAAFGCPPREAVRHAVNWPTGAGYIVRPGRSDRFCVPRAVRGSPPGSGFRQHGTSSGRTRTSTFSTAWACRVLPSAIRPECEPVADRSAQRARRGRSGCQDHPSTVAAWAIMRHLGIGAPVWMTGIRI
ncbi:hypothetical protein AB0J72_34325 [Dactylosporangium sp. NPDC049742]|uniref:hypothetical protein n=1 Tax=Dactylosporangium sp. NPDC049742 TaxID=3154737 RepID=UPI0034223B11